MASYNTSGVTSYDPRNLGGSEGYGPSKPSSNGLASKPKVSKMDSDMYAGSKYSPTSGAGTSKAKQTYSSAAAATANDDNVSYGQSYSPNVMSAAFTSAGAVLPPPAVSKPLTFRDYTGGSLYDSDIFKPKILPDNSSDINNFLGRSAIDDALREALGPSKMPEIYLGQSAEEPEPNIDMSILQGALQPEPITVKEIEVKAGDTLTGIAAANNVPVQDVIDANPQIKNPDLIRPGEVVSVPDPRFEGVPKPRGVADSPRLSEGVADPRNLGGAEGYGRVGTFADAEIGEGLMSPRFDTKGETPEGEPTKRLDTKGESPVDSTTIMASVRDKDVTTNSVVDMNKVESLILDTVGRNKYSAGILGAIKTEVGEGVKDESPYYSLQGAYDVWTDSDVDDALNNLPVEQASRLRADQTAGVRTGGQASKEDRKALGEAMFDKKYDGGKKYKGRGLIQITHKSTYKEIGKRLGLDLVANPELVNDPKYAVPAALAYLDYKGYFKLKDSEITKNKLQALVNPSAPTKTKNERWSFTEAYLKNIQDEGGAVETSLRPKARK